MIGKRCPIIGLSSFWRGLSGVNAGCTPGCAQGAEVIDPFPRLLDQNLLDNHANFKRAGE